MILNANNVHSVFKLNKTSTYRSSHPEGFLGKGALKICSKFTGEHTRQSVILIKLLCNFIEITFWDGCSPVNLLNTFRTPFLKNTSEWLLLYLKHKISLISDSITHIQTYQNSFLHHFFYHHIFLPSLPLGLAHLALLKNKQYLIPFLW